MCEMCQSRMAAALKECTVADLNWLEKQGPRVQKAAMRATLFTVHENVYEEGHEEGCRDNDLEWEKALRPITEALWRVAEKMTDPVEEQHRQEIEELADRIRGLYS
jgi:hypothetical protein